MADAESERRAILQDAREGFGAEGSMPSRLDRLDSAWDGPAASSSSALRPRLAWALQSGASSAEATTSNRGGVELRSMRGGFWIEGRSSGWRVAFGSDRESGESLPLDAWTAGVEGRPAATDFHIAAGSLRFRPGFGLLMDLGAWPTSSSLSPLSERTPGLQDSPRHAPLWGVALHWAPPGFRCWVASAGLAVDASIRGGNAQVDTPFASSFEVQPGRRVDAESNRWGRLGVGATCVDLSWGDASWHGGVAATALRFALPVAFGEPSAPTGRGVCGLAGRMAWRGREVDGALEAAWQLRPVVDEEWQMATSVSNASSYALAAQVQAHPGAGRLQIGGRWYSGRWTDRFSALTRATHGAAEASVSLKMRWPLHANWRAEVDGETAFGFAEADLPGGPDDGAMKSRVRWALVWQPRRGPQSRISAVFAPDRTPVGNLAVEGAVAPWRASAALRVEGASPVPLLGLQSRLELRVESWTWALDLDAAVLPPKSVWFWYQGQGRDAVLQSARSAEGSPMTWAGGASTGVTWRRGPWTAGLDIGWDSVRGSWTAGLRWTGRLEGAFTEAQRPQGPRS